MWIQIRSMDGKVSHRVDGLSKLTKIEELRMLLVEKFDAPVEQQRLFYRGKQLEDGHSLFDYDVGLNDIIQIIIKQLEDSQKKSTITAENTNKENDNIKKRHPENSEEHLTSKYYEVGDLVDAKDTVHGAWFEAKIVGIKPSADKQVSSCVPECHSSLCNHNTNDRFDDGLTYVVVFDDYEDCEAPSELKLHFIRPRARKRLEFSDIKKGDQVMVNYNIEEPNERGFWYDCKMTSLKQNRTKNEIIGTLIIGIEETELENCKIRFTDEIFAVEKTRPLSKECDGEKEEAPAARSKMPKCSHCKDNPSRKCKECSCRVCGGKDSPEKQIMCDECDDAYHLWCVQPPLTQIPEQDDWYCPTCKVDETEVVRAGEKLKASKKKSKMASAKNASTSRDWGKGMACVGRTKECTIVPSNHFGLIPGVEVGTMWKYRVQVSESGVHRPHVAGIHGRGEEGAYSIVLSGGYEDDLDEGEEFKYTGSGGRDLSGNKRCAEQSCDQALTRMNKALAINCNAKLNKEGAEAEDWRGGKPVRVVRNCKGRKHSEYSPEEGNRYDGIYKVVKYWPEKGKSGFLVWRYLLRRDDPVPAPWTKAGKKRIKELGLEMQYPEGYEVKGEKEEDGDVTSPKKRGKRKNSDVESSGKKKKKTTAHSLSPEVEKLIRRDDVNKKIWDECLEVVTEGSQEFLKKVESSFACICCQEVVYDPITTVCSHNICKSCLSRSFKAEVFSCPMCRQDLEKNILNKKNEPLQKALSSLFPGYEVGR